MKFRLRLNNKGNYLVEYKIGWWVFSIWVPIYDEYSIYNSLPKIYTSKFKAEEAIKEYCKCIKAKKEKEEKIKQIQKEYYSCKDFIKE